MKENNWYKKGYQAGKLQTQQDEVKELRRIFNKLDNNGHMHADKWLKLENWIINKEDKLQEKN